MARWNIRGTNGKEMETYEVTNGTKIHTETKKKERGVTKLHVIIHREVLIAHHMGIFLPFEISLLVVGRYGVTH